MSALLAMMMLLFAAEGEPWPQRGDLVYISAKLQWTAAVMIIFGASPRVDEIPACVPLEVRRNQPSKERLLVREGGAREMELLGPWSRRLHRTEASCDEQYSREGEPKVVRMGSSNKIVARAQTSPAEGSEPVQ